VYCQKPLTHSIYEARALALAADYYKVQTQMGNQAHAGEPIRRAVELVRAGIIGPVREVHAWSGTPRTAKAVWPGEGPATRPAGLNWDLWLGPRADRPYSGKLTPFVWRWVWDFGNGTMPDMSPHHFDPAFNALDLDAPTTIEARTSFVDPEVTIGSNLITYRYAARGDRGPLTVCWYDNGLRPALPLDVDPDDPRQRLGDGNDGLLLVGDKGLITCAGWSGMPRLLPMELHRSYTRPPKTIPRVAGHHADWLQACKGGTPACSNFGYGARLTEFVLLGALALRTGKVLKWDAAGMKVANNVPEAQPLIDGSYRKGWELAV